MKHKIMRCNGLLIAEIEADTLAQAVTLACQAGQSLAGLDLSGSDLRGSDLRGSDLSDSDLRGSNLSGSDLRGSNLSGSNLSGSNLSGSNLSGSDLSDSDLRGSDLRGSDLSGSNLRGSDLRGSNLSESDLSDIPIVPNIDRAILSAIEAGGSLEMGNWHTCGTTHCRGGWAIRLAGEPGAELEKRIGTPAAAALIYAVSRPDRPLPDFYATNTDAMDDIRECAAAE